MSKSVILDYIELVMSMIESPSEVKVQLENELMRKLLETAESTSIEAVKNSLLSPKDLAKEISEKLAYEKKKEETESTGAKPDTDIKSCRYRYPRYKSECIREHNGVDFKLLYIPLIQISSGTQKITMPLIDEYDECDD